MNENRHKIFSFVFIFATVLLMCGCMFALFACEEEHSHTMQHHAAISPGCAKAGNIEYWECTGCGKLFSDSAGVTEIAADDIVVAATGTHTWGAWTTTAATCTEDGARTRACSICGLEEREDIPAAHTLTHYPALAAACGSAGNIEYYYCTVCFKYFADEGAEEEIAQEDISLPATEEHTWSEWSEVVATCTEGGVSERDCTVCGRHEEQTISPLGHTLTAHTEIPATCGASGVKAYWECSVCTLLFADEEAVTEITVEELTIPATGTHSYGEWVQDAAPTCTAAGHRVRTCSVCTHTEEEGVDATGHSMTHISAVAATCENEGVAEHYRCTACALHFADEAGTEEMENTVIPRLAHDMTHTEAVAPTCESDGNIEYWTCSLCDKIYADAEGYELTSGSLIIPAIAHANKAHHSTVEATCESDGNIEYWFCPDCGKNLDADEREITSGVGIKAGHILYHVEGAEATCNATGMAEHWRCSRCFGYFTDAEGREQTQEAALIIPMSETHIYVDHVCTVCGGYQPAEEYATSGLRFDSSFSFMVTGVGSATDTNIVIPAYNGNIKITTVAAGAFRNFTGESVTIPCTVTTIESGAFEGCTAQIIFEENSSLKQLANGAFKGYLGERIVLPRGIERLGSYSGGSDNPPFANCTNLKEIYIPVSVTFICGACFSGCNAFVIQYEGTQEQYDAISKENYSVGATYDEQMEVPYPTV